MIKTLFADWIFPALGQPERNAGIGTTFINHEARIRAIRIYHAYK